MADLLENIASWEKGSKDILLNLSAQPVREGMSRISTGLVDICFHRYTQVVVSHHAIERWKERVASNYTREEIQRTLEVILKYCHSRLTAVGEGRLTIDNDILIEYAVSKNKRIVTVVTILGRLKNSPDLLLLMNNPNYIKKRGAKLDLVVSREILNKDIHVPVPHKAAVWTADGAIRSVEVYTKEGSDTPLIITAEISVAKRNGIRKADYMSKGLTGRVHISNLWVLYKLGLKREVLEFLRQNHFTPLAKEIAAGVLEPKLDSLVYRGQVGELGIRDIEERIL